MKTLVRIEAQTLENGRPKGGQEFTLRADSDFFLYEKSECVEVIKDMLKEVSKNWVEDFEYISHELVFHEPTELSGEDFEKRVREKTMA